MKQKNCTCSNRTYVLGFLVLTFLCWCPLGYGSYGQVPRLLGVPYWAVAALAVAAVLFVVEWVYLFHSQLAMNDEELPEIIAQLKAVEIDSPVPAKEDE